MNGRLASAAASAAGEAANREILLASRVVGDGVWETDLSVPGIHCGACIQRVERLLIGLAGVEHARANLSSKRVAIRWRGDAAPPAIEALAAAGYDAHLHDAEPDAKDDTLAALIRALAVAGFASANIMSLSVSIWAGADAATRDLFHALSALIALPAVAYAGRVFFVSACRSLRRGQTNMDVPISVGVLLAFGLSLYETIHRGPHAYFDAAISLLFVLLIGRTLDHVTRERARVAVRGLMRLAPRGAVVRRADGTRAHLPVEEIRPGMSILLDAGERVPVDSRVAEGTSEIDRSLVTGESLPQPVAGGAELQAGTLNLAAPLTITATAAARESFLAEMVRMMEAAESGRSTYRRIADRAARLYAPVVHLTAFLTFVGWMIADGDVHDSLTIAIAVLIITCPCALGLAVPMVQVMAARRLFDDGIVARDGGALERLAEIDAVIFDKTGTLTLGAARHVDGDDVDPATLALAAAIAAHSRHPYSRAIVAMAAGPPLLALDEIAEHPGAGLEARLGDARYRLGRADWALPPAGASAAADEMSDVVLSHDGRGLARFRFADRLRPDARAAIVELEHSGLGVEIVSGDREESVRRFAAEMGVPYAARVSPGGKVAHIAAVEASGRRVLMVGDGLNDAPALAAAHASMAPSSAADVGRNAADVVFLRESLLAVPRAIAVARDAGRLVRQNLALAIAYNAIAVPVAILGYVTPLVAAVAMSLSSLLVVANAMRVKAPAQAVRAGAAPQARVAPPRLSFGKGR